MFALGEPEHISCWSNHQAPEGKLLRSHRLCLPNSGLQHSGAGHNLPIKIFFSDFIGIFLAAIQYFSKKLQYGTLDQSQAKIFRLWLDPYSKGESTSLLPAPAESEHAWTGVSPGQGALRAASGGWHQGRQT